MFSQRNSAANYHHMPVLFSSAICLRNSFNLSFSLRTQFSEAICIVPKLCACIISSNSFNIPIGIARGICRKIIFLVCISCKTIFYCEISNRGGNYFRKRCDLTLTFRDLWLSTVDKSLSNMNSMSFYDPHANDFSDLR